MPQPRGILHTRRAEDSDRPGGEDAVGDGASERVSGHARTSAGFAERGGSEKRAKPTKHVSFNERTIRDPAPTKQVSFRGPVLGAPAETQPSASLSFRSSSPTHSRYSSDTGGDRVSMGDGDSAHDDQPVEVKCGFLKCRHVYEIEALEIVDLPASRLPSAAAEPLGIAAQYVSCTVERRAAPMEPATGNTLTRGGSNRPLRVSNDLRRVRRSAFSGAGDAARDGDALPPVFLVARIAAEEVGPFRYDVEVEVGPEDPSGGAGGQDDGDEARQAKRLNVALVGVVMGEGKGTPQPRAYVRCLGKSADYDTEC
ncbi:unnamed protein product [Pedinophyceae sp. YPF-701]|nr:unnamed protein product [Pedinophyceae sp. YPF-701]